MSRSMPAPLKRGLAVAVLLGLALGPAWTAQSTQAPSRKGMVEAPASTGSVTVPSPAPPERETVPCALVRKKLWAEREGWIVRRVPICG